MARQPVRPTTPTDVWGVYAASRYKSGIAAPTIIAYGKHAVGERSHRTNHKPHKPSCVAATPHVNYLAATQLIIFDGSFENLWPRAPYGALAIGYYYKRCSAAILPLRGYVSKKTSAIARSARPPRLKRAPTTHILCGRAERAPLPLYIMTLLLREVAQQPISSSAQPPKPASYDIRAN